MFNILFYRTFPKAKCYCHTTEDTMFVTYPEVNVQCFHCTIWLTEIK